MQAAFCLKPDALETKSFRTPFYMSNLEDCKKASFVQKSVSKEPKKTQNLSKSRNRPKPQTTANKYRNLVPALSQNRSAANANLAKNKLLLQTLTRDTIDKTKVLGIKQSSIDSSDL